MKIQKCENQKVFVEIPLTTQSGKTRVKLAIASMSMDYPLLQGKYPFHKSTI